MGSVSNVCITEEAARGGADQRRGTDLAREVCTLEGERGLLSKAGRGELLQSLTVCLCAQRCPVVAGRPTACIALVCCRGWVAASAQPWFRSRRRKGCNLALHTLSCMEGFHMADVWGLLCVMAVEPRATCMHLYTT